MNRAELFAQISQKQSYLCVGLDTDLTKIPSHLRNEKDPIFEFNKQIIDATYKYCVAYKPNTAFYECNGSKGWESLQKTIEYIPKDVFTIADAKRADIGNTSSMYARAFFNKSESGLEFDAVTVAPYMGEDSIAPFLKFPNKWAIVLGLTSNEGSQDFQALKISDGAYLYQHVIKKVSTWGTPDQLMFVIGATKAEDFSEIRKIIPDYFLLVPGVGAQGGDLKILSQNGFNSQCGLLVNSSRNIIYASSEKDFALHAEKVARNMAKEMEVYLQEYLK
ncbi:MAG: orotidine-5'-phosphate decarboxylase [Cytophagales bacterium]|nr:MAG: orotidine-5'-phosphate decarboxylase [Cytophagales bacterium]